jgi:hypothetical protein
MNFNNLVLETLSKTESYYGKEITFKDEDTGEKLTGTLVDPDVIDDIQTDNCHGPHITDEWYGANANWHSNNVNSKGEGFNEFLDNNPKWYLVATGSWETCPHQGDFHIVSADIVVPQLLKHKLTTQAKDTFGDLIDEL